MYPVVIASAPRTGSSFVARNLQEKFGVVFSSIVIKDSNNPNGYYEDPNLLRINRDRIRRWQKGKTWDEQIDYIWLSEFNQWAKKMSQYGKWGFKDPRMIPWLRQALRLFKDPTIIITDRSDEQIKNSQVKKLKIDKKAVEVGIVAYRRLIQEAVSGYRYYTIDLTKHISDKKIEKKLRKWLM